MAHLALFLWLSLIATGILGILQFQHKKLKPAELMGLFLFGIFLSIPFLMVEHFAMHLKYYLVILAFIIIEGLVLTIEHEWKYLHDLIHHNIKHLRIISFFVISLGFTFSELSVYILTSHENLVTILNLLPLKGIFALFTHTVLTSGSSLIRVGESIFEHITLLFVYYLRLAFVSSSHYLYVFIAEHHYVYFLIPFVALNLFLFFKHKKQIDLELETKKTYRKISISKKRLFGCSSRRARGSDRSVVNTT